MGRAVTIAMMAVFLVMGKLVQGDPILLSVTVRYPTQHLCSHNCQLEFITSLNDWEFPSPKQLLVPSGQPNEFVGWVSYPPDFVGKTIQLSIVYTFQLGNSTDWESLYRLIVAEVELIKGCPSFWLGGKMTQLGTTPAVELQEGGSSVVVYPYFCTQHSQRNVLENVYSPQLDNTRHIAVQVPPGMVENPLPRAVQFTMKSRKKSH